MQFVLQSTRLGLRNSAARIPFRYGNACLTRCPQAVLEAEVEVEGARHRGYSGDCLPPGWFDKNPALGFREQIDDMLAVTGLAQRVFAEEASGPTEFFPAWLAAYHRVMALCQTQECQPLLASFGLSLVERAVMDALARTAEMSFARAVRENIYAIQPGEVHPGLAGCEPRDWLPAEPVRSIYVRHTVGLSDALTAADIPPGERVEDGFPQAVEEYVVGHGLRYFKLKLSNRLEHDRARLLAFAAMVERHLGADYRLTLDGNEQYKQAAEFDEFIDMLRETPQLATLWRNTLAVEQPLARGIALEEEHTAGVRELSTRVPVIIDESDAALDSYARAIRLGYRGVSSKNCKGPVKSLLNAGLTWLHNDRGAASAYLMTGEDLCTLGVVPLQADLCLVATLGLSHVERNGHHYQRGLSYLSPGEQRQALAAHGDLYAEQHGTVAPILRDGRFEIASLDCPGFGFAALPDMEAMESAETWRYESLGLED